ncbi:hypothetical protein PROFUN_13335 [Planoprotostelium fungivorum]|uniref:Uncharacterized protein n=1 Tax=Planoprotostelium fungivorum TaxID=1890364 RepID=A0A2P6N4L5_9EUKA|nr:hypothetical protein PROFUN_13335 [Planoprotostelium fungivorum]
MFFSIIPLKAIPQQGYEETSALSLAPITFRSGYLKKWSTKGPVGRWTKKWIVVTTSDMVFYFKSPKDSYPKGYLDMLKYNDIVDTFSEKGSEPTTKDHDSPSQRCIFQAETEEDKLSWMSTFRSAMNRAGMNGLRKRCLEMQATGRKMRMQSMLYVRVAEARNLKPHSDAFCLVQIGAQTVSTQTIYKTDSPLWGEEFELDLTEKSASDIMEESVNITVMDHSGRRDGIIPMQQLIDQQPNEQWYELQSKKSEDFISGEVLVELTYTPASKSSAALLSIKLIEGRNLVANDTNDLCSPFVVIRHGTEKKKSSTALKTLNPSWNFSTTFELTVDNIKEDVRVIVKDKERTHSTKLGQVSFSVSTLTPNTPVKNWYTLTGRAERRSMMRREKSISSNEDLSLGDIRLRLKYSETQILTLDNYSELWDLINAGDYAIIDALGEVTSDRDGVAKNLVRLYEGRGKAVDLLNHLTEREISSTASEDVIFRGNSIATKSVDNYMKLIGLKFLYKVMARKVKEICSSRKSFEVDPSRVDKQEKIDENASGLMEATTAIAQVIFQSVDQTPYELRQIFSGIQRGVVKKWGAQNIVRWTAVSGFIFLRFWGPAILGPKLFKLLDDHPDVDTSRIQKMGNLAQFEGKEPHLAFMNPCIEQNQDRVKVYIDKISTAPSSAASPNQTRDHVIDVEAEMSLLYTTLCRDRVKLAALNQEKPSPYLSKLETVLNAVGEKYIATIENQSLK